MRSGRIRWRALFGLLLIAVGLFFDWYWVWGILFVFWALMDIKSGYTHLLEEVPRSENPIIFWIIVLLWGGLAVWALSFFNWQQVKEDVQYTYYSYTVPESVEQIAANESAPSVAISSGTDAGKTVITGGKSEAVPTAKKSVKNELVRKKVTPVDSKNVSKSSDAVTAPIASNIPSAADKANVASETIAQREKHVPPKLTNRWVRSEKRKFKVLVPARWESTTSDNDTTTIMTLQAPKKHGVVTIIAVNWGTPISTPDFQKYMEKELKKDFPVMNASEGVLFDGPKGSKFRRWRERYNGNRTNMIATYQTSGTMGYVYLGWYGEKDSATKKSVMDIYKNFIVEK